jgi:ribosomal protein S27AE
MALKPSKMMCVTCKKIKPYTGEYFKINEDIKVIRLNRQCTTCGKRALLNNHYMRTYGMSVDEVEAMAQAQQGKCAICNRNRKLGVDHNHTTGLVRQLLCDKCNRGIGFLEENITILNNAIEYLEKYNA